MHIPSWALGTLLGLVVNAPWTILNLRMEKAFGARISKLGARVAHLEDRVRVLEAA